MKKVVKSIFSFPTVTKSKVSLLLGLTTMATFFEGFGVAMLFSVMDFIEKRKDFATLADSSRMWSYIEGAFGLLHIPRTLVSLMAVVFGLLLIKQLFSYWKNLYGAWLTESVLEGVRNEGFESFIKAKMEFFDSMAVGQLVDALGVDGQRAVKGVFSFFSLLVATAVFVFYFVFLLVLSFELTLFAMAIIAVVVLVFRPLIAKTAKIGVCISKNSGKLSSAIIERLEMARVVKLACKEDEETQHIAGFSKSIKIGSYSIARLRAKMEFVTDPMVVLVGLTILYVSIEIYHTGLAKVGVFILVLLRLMPHVKNIFNSRQSLAASTGSITKVEELLGEAKNKKEEGIE